METRARSTRPGRGGSCAASDDWSWCGYLPTEQSAEAQAEKEDIIGPHLKAMHGSPRTANVGGVELGLQVEENVPDVWPAKVSA